MRKHEGQRGSALIMALLVILVLSIIGIGIAYLTTTEDRISGNDKVSKTGFYAAEAGLRNGESLLQTYISNGSKKIDDLLTCTTDTTYKPPGGGWTACPLVINGVWVKDQPTENVPKDLSGRGVYTLYVRNNQDDPFGSATHDGDLKLNIISVGEYVAVDSSNPPNILSRSIQKVLEEELNVVAPGAMVNTNPSGTGSGAF
jgi:hypothetical protein